MLLDVPRFVSMVPMLVQGDLTVTVSELPLLFRLTSPSVLWLLVSPDQPVQIVETSAAPSR